LIKHHKFWVVPLIAGWSSGLALAQETPQKNPPQEVTVTGSQTDIEAGRDFIAGRIIIGRKRIDESGLHNVGELLKQVPAISIGKDGRIGLLGLPGYTQILIDGEAGVSQGKSPTELELVRVEKIEIIKSSVAEFGPFGIAGTINIVTRKIDRKKTEQLRLGVNNVTSKLGGDLSWAYSQTEAGSPLSFSLQFSANEKTSTEDSQRQLTSLAPLTMPGTTRLWAGDMQSETKSSSLSLSSTLNWQIDAKNKISFSPSINSMLGEQTNIEHRRWADGNILDAVQRNRTPLDSFWSGLTWTHTPDKQQRLELKWNSNHFHSLLENRRFELQNAQTSSLRIDTQRRDTDADALRLDYKAGLPGGHDVKAGVQLNLSKEESDYTYLINGATDSSLAYLGKQRSARQEKRRIFLQDDWRYSEALAFNAGISTEDSVADIHEGSYSSQSRYRLWSPSFHIAKKFDGDSDRSLRISLARSFKAPWLDQLTARPQINPLAPCPVNGLCAANSLDTADSAGNPALQPERSLGLNISYEHGFGKDSQVSLEMYTRKIERKIGIDIAREIVAWANAPRYVSRPVNLGDASVRGLDLEMQLAARDVWPDAPKLDVRASIGLSQSEVSAIPGPDNRLDKQTPWRAKLGGSYAFKDLPLKMDIDANWAPGNWVRNSVSQRVFQDRTFGLSSNAAWTISPSKRLFVNLDNLGARKSRQINEYISNEIVRQQIDTDSHPRLSIRLEMKL
jgi:outer membrane receptor for ferrienterochelin and colicins